MTSDKDNTIFEKTSFLQGNNSPFIKELYLKYLNDPRSVPESWTKFFNGLDEDREIIHKEISGPSWAPKSKNTLSNIIETNGVTEETESSANGTSELEDNYEKQKEQSVKAIALIRAYRIRGHLISNLDPLEMME